MAKTRETKGYLEGWIDRMRVWVDSVARRCATRLYGEEDIKQEAYIKLWHCLEKYPDMPEVEMVGMFKHSFCRRLADLLSQARNKRKEPFSLNVKIDVRSEWRGEHDERWYRERIVELTAMCDAPDLKRWIKKSLKPGRNGKGMSAEIYEEFRYLASRCST